MSTRTITNQGQPWMTPDDQPIAGVVIEFDLVDLSGRYVGRMDASGVTWIGGWRGETDANGEFSVTLEANEGLEQSAYVIRRITSWVTETWTVQIPDGAGPLAWADLIELDVVLDAVPLGRLQQHLADQALHLAAHERAALSAANSPSADNPLATLSDIGEGVAGPPGPDGASAYQVWLDAGNTGTEQDYLDSLQGPAGADGADGAQGLPGTDGVDGAQGLPGADGASAYQVWLDAGNTGTEQDYLASLQGPAGADGADGAQGLPGADGASAYQVWLDAGNTGTEQDYLASLEGPAGADGADGVFADDQKINGFQLEFIDVPNPGPSYTVPLDGRVYRINLTQDLTLNVTPLPLPLVGSAGIWFTQDAAGNHLVSFPPGAHWRNSQLEGVDPTPNATSNCRADSTAMGTVQIGVSAFGLPA